MLRLKNIEKSFGSHTVFTIDELSLGPGIYWLKGANGSGKSTLLKILGGLLPFKGEIRLDGQLEIRKQPSAYRMQVAYSPAEPVYPSFLTGEQLVDFVRRIRKGSSDQERHTRDLLGIDNYLINPAGSYSSGMLKKLSLLMAFTGNPKVILLDEPFTTLDTDSQLALCQLIRERRQAGASFILTSHHDIETASLDFTNVFLMKDKNLTEISR